MGVVEGFIIKPEQQKLNVADRISVKAARVRMRSRKPLTKKDQIIA